ncbi:hypothetical protein A9Q91_05540 [Candidatus Gracilibacteria bacterium 28_42_T64]|nr:hypothetical protein A9Q91_05540 [Candidatus Gracilibacteria bacterium 28_42_T64]
MTNLKRNINQNSNISQIMNEYGDFIGTQFHGTTINSVDEFSKHINDTLKTEKRSLIPISSYSGRGKSTFVDDLTEEGIILPKKGEAITGYVVGDKIDSKGYIHGNTSVFHAEADWFFEALGQDRYDQMMETYENFVKYYGDEQHAVSVILKFLNQNKYFVERGVYGKTQDEKTKKQKTAKLFFDESPEDNSRLTILDGTNSIEIANLVKDATSQNKIKILKILIDPCPETSFMGILKRDVLHLEKDLDIVLNFRLKEFAYITKRWIKEALEDKETLLYDDYDRFNYSFHPNFLTNVIRKLELHKKLLLSSLKEEDTKAFIEVFSNNLIETFTRMLDNKNS